MKTLDNFMQLGKQVSSGVYLMGGTVDGADTLVKSATASQGGDPEGISFPVRVQSADSATVFQVMWASYTLDGADHKLELDTVITSSSGTSTIEFSTDVDSLRFYGVASSELLNIIAVNRDSLADGWVATTDTWTYATASTFTISSVDRTSQFPIGAKLKLVNDGLTKYFYVTASVFSTNTTVTVTGGSDYTLANSAITLPNYAYVTTPQGFPGKFNYTPTYTNLTIGNGTSDYSFSLDSRTLCISGDTTFGSTSSVDGTGVLISLPFAGSSLSVFQGVGSASIHDSGADIYNGVAVVAADTSIEIYALAASGTYAARAQLSSSIPMTWTTSDQIVFGATIVI